MSSKLDLLTDLKSQIEKMRSQGDFYIKADLLIDIISEVAEGDLADDLPPAEVEKYKFQLQSKLEQYKADASVRQIIYSSVITTGQGAIKAALVITGGASVALLAFIGHLARVEPGKISSFALPLSLFVFSLLASAVLSGGTYLSQAFLAGFSNITGKISISFAISCIILGIAIYVTFGYAAYVTYQEFVNFTSAAKP